MHETSLPLKPPKCGSQTTPGPKERNNTTNMRSIASDASEQLFPSNQFTALHSQPDEQRRLEGLGCQRHELQLLTFPFLSPKPLMKTSRQVPEALAHNPPQSPDGTTTPAESPRECRSPPTGGRRLGQTSGSEERRSSALSGRHRWCR
jgi:hypothetical protein